MAKVPKSFHSELASLRKWKKSHDLTQAQHTPLNPPVAQTPVKTPHKAALRAQSLASAKATHDAVNMSRKQVGMSELDFDMNAFEAMFTRLHGEGVHRIRAVDGNLINTALGLSPTQLAVATRQMTKAQQQAAMKLAIQNELLKL